MDTQQNEKLMLAKPFATWGLVCERQPTGVQTANVEWVEVKHSPDGYEWGYGGSGPADLALNTLLAAARLGYLSQEEARAWYQEFKWAHLARMPLAGGNVPLGDIITWAIQQRENRRISQL